MGATESSPATPTCKPFLNKHLAHVSDPRSPTAGILRTPIEVASSPQDNPLTEPKEEEASAGKENPGGDPRSPTPGISRTPMKAMVSDTLNSLVKQLSEAFVAETPDQELLLEEPLSQEQKPGVAIAVEEELCGGRSLRKDDSDRNVSLGQSPLWTEEKDKQPYLGTFTGAVMRPACFTSAPCPAGGKPTRRKTSSKILAAAASGGAGRSPLSTLQDDNSPTTLTPCQGKRHLSLTENSGERKEVAANSRLGLKPGSCAWDALNKENQQCHLVQN
uniref:Cell division cycle-associated protein 3 n=1 Tax=Sphenodon punctatus TaxID=8508 RepID=A0A8D0HD24_SPHPU